jgi:hypothetical protein
MSEPRSAGNAISLDTTQEKWRFWLPAQLPKSALWFGFPRVLLREHSVRDHAPLCRASVMPATITARASRRCRRPRPPPALGVFFRTSNAAASASAFSFRASSRSRARIRFIVANDACPSSPNRSPLFVFRLEHILACQAFLQLGGGKRARLGQDPDLLLNRPVAPRALGGVTGRLLASCIHRDSVCSLIGSLPARRATIFCLKANKNGLVTGSFPSRPTEQPFPEPTKSWWGARRVRAVSSPAEGLGTWRQLPRFRAHLASDPLYHHSCRLARRAMLPPATPRTRRIWRWISRARLSRNSACDNTSITATSKNTRVLIQLKMLGHCRPSGAGPPPSVLRHRDDSVTTIRARPSVVRHTRRRQRKRELADWDSN